MLGKSKSYVWNSFWMVLEKVLRLFSGIVAAVLLARYLGPAGYGDLNYIIAYVAIFLPLAEFGMSSILVRDLILFRKEESKFLGSSFYLMLFFSLLSILVLNGIKVLIQTDDILNNLILIYSLILFFKPFDMIDFYFQSKVKAKTSSIAKSIALIISLSAKLYFIFIEASLTYLLYAFLLEYIVTALFLIYFYFSQKNVRFFMFFEKEIVFKLIKSAWPMLLSSISVILYMRIDQIMLKNMVSSKELGLYSSSIRLYEGYVSLIIVLTISLMPAIMALKQSSEIKYKEGITKLFSLVFWGNNLVALILTFLSPFIIDFLYGEEYSGSYVVFAIIFWASSFASMGSITARYLVIENKERKQALRTFVSLFANVAINLFLIPLYGKEGAAVATLISLFLGNYLTDVLDKDMKDLLRMKNNAILFRFNMVSK